ncbi:hypothetical protein VPH35_017599 [Triticum aestivum]
MATRYWIAALPVADDNVAAGKTALWARLQDAISRHSFDTPLYRFTVPDLRPGTLDSLLALSDDLVKSNIFIEGVSHKIRRQIEDLERAGGVEPGTLTVDGVPVDSYLTRSAPSACALCRCLHSSSANCLHSSTVPDDGCRFVWDEGKYPVNAPLKETVASIQSQVAKIEDDMKVRVAEYGNVKSQLGTINRKQTGSLAVRDLSNLIKPEDMVTSEHLVTLLSIVPKYSQKDWLSSYESLDTFVIRDFEYSPEAQESRKQELEKLLQDQEVMRTSLLQWCYASYSEVFSSWMHFSAVRVFVESILRYGLPARFLSVVLAPSTKSEKKVRNILEGLCGNANSSYWRSEDDVGMAAGLGGETESHPYVSFTINFV